MIKDFEINDILSAVNSISKINRKKGNTEDMKRNLNDKNNVLTLNNDVKPNKGEILVLDQTIE